MLQPNSKSSSLENLPQEANPSGNFFVQQQWQAIKLQQTLVKQQPVKRLRHEQT